MPLSTPSFRALCRQFAAFIGVGAIATTVDFIMFLGLTMGLGVTSVLAALAGYASGGLVSYALSRSFVFASERSHRDAGWRFALVTGSGFALTGGAMMVMTGTLGMPSVIARLLTYALVLIFNYLAHRFFTFRR